MMRILRYFLVLAFLVLTAGTALAQSVTTHKVKRGETIYGIARSYGLTEAELRAANPGMERSDYVLKKGSKIIIPTAGQTQTSSADAPMENDDVRQRSIRMGVMLPLHDINGDGRRWTVRAVFARCPLRNGMGNVPRRSCGRSIQQVEKRRPTRWTTPFPLENSQH